MSAMTMCVRRVSTAFGLLMLAISVTHAAGALAAGRCGGGGISLNHPTLNQAHAGAIKQCQGFGVQDCRVVATARKGCMALARDMANACKINTYAVAATEIEAVNIALDKCQAEGGTQCRLATFACDTTG